MGTLAGTPQWNTPAGGNHDWVEFWDAGAWSFLGAAEPAPPNITWCEPACTMLVLALLMLEGKHGVHVASLDAAELLAGAAHCRTGA